MHLPCRRHYSLPTPPYLLFGANPRNNLRLESTFAVNSNVKCSGSFISLSVTYREMHRQAGHWIVGCHKFR
ncbi:hypothetical protein BDV09DRAFT_176211 [Aspergillus tetrazonus]